jgi:hypothetical protein
VDASRLTSRAGGRPRRQRAGRRAPKRPMVQDVGSSRVRGPSSSAVTLGPSPDHRSPVGATGTGPDQNVLDSTGKGMTMDVATIRGASSRCRRVGSRPTETTAGEVAVPWTLHELSAGTPDPGASRGLVSV